MKTVELLAPAGDPDAGYAALQYGANAIYLGMKRFSARAEAGNFTVTQLGEIVCYAHALTPRRSVYVALNTLIYDAELDDVIELLHDIADTGADALIVQDMGVARLVRRYFPGLRLHASTQMAMHSLDGVRAAEEVGFSRVTLARELTLEEVRSIAESAAIEVEVFIHGALCYSYSGLCLYSALLRGRSGNRGRCSYPCRDVFTTEDGKTSGLLFSMKDLALPGLIPDLCRAGVASLKIEGRKKSPLYVASAVSLYRQLLDGVPIGQCERDGTLDDIKTVFSRPWTNLYNRSRAERGVVDPDHVGHRGVPVARLSSLLQEGGKSWAQFRTCRRLERHDGLQVEMRGEPKPFGFAVDDMRIGDRNGRWLRVYEAPAGADVRVALPAVHPGIAAGATIYCSSSQAVKQRYRYSRPRPGVHRVRRTIDVKVQVSPRAVAAEASFRDDPSRLAKVRVTGEWEPCRDAAVADVGFQGAFDRLGNTDYRPGNIVIGNTDGLFVPASVVNRLRRDLVRELDGLRAECRLNRIRECRLKEAASPLLSQKRELQWVVKVDRLAYLDHWDYADWDGVREAVIVITEGTVEELATNVTRLRETHPRVLIRLALPVLAREWERSAILLKVKRMLGAGFTNWEVSSLGGVRLLKSACAEEGLDEVLNIASDWPLYAMNRSAFRALMEFGLQRIAISPENNEDNVISLLSSYGDRLVLPLYTDAPLYLSETCPNTSAKWQCSSSCRCMEEGTRLRSGKAHVLMLHQGCRTVVLNHIPYCVASRVASLCRHGLRNVRADFVWRSYQPGDVVSVWRGLRRGDRVPGYDPWDMLRQSDG